MAEPELLFETTDVLIEAPNWSLDGSSLFVNGNGALWRLDIDSPRRGLTRIHFDGLPDLNNDHVLDPDGQHIYLSAMDGHIYRGRLDGGTVERVSPTDGKWHFLHGVSPDGERLAYVEIDDFAVPGRLAVIEPYGSPTVLDTGPGHVDGPEWSPDGNWIYFNTEAFTDDPGHAQLARMPDPGGPVQRLVAGNTVDWFPHLSPDSRWATYLAFPPGTVGHPADLDVEVRVVSVDNWPSILQRYPLFGGQGTINVNSWSPDSTRFAFIAYPIA
ncbi:WD40 repeat protein [Kribbella sp. VKM Ac-2527]|uniref:WD40 repeat protein n=1 Tax=Kribbella caucasensis TaxID=2512215 RepID=A0A4R6KKS6_9ACTN|nr:biopolymer transporter Tol [Kribbella sp. VKM Ac-2527]TDO51591.1 WD40 repeat protein [Kribbella sp. VKM Ac-2527]